VACHMVNDPTVGPQITQRAGHIVEEVKAASGTGPDRQFTPARDVGNR